MNTNIYFWISSILRAKSIKKNESGAALMEYSILLGMIAVAVIALVVLAGDWVVAQWTALTGALNTASGGGGTTPAP